MYRDPRNCEGIVPDDEPGDENEKKLGYEVKSAKDFNSNQKRKKKLPTCVLLSMDGPKLILLFGLS